MYAGEQIQQTVDYIDKHLGEELAIDNLAEMASLSPFYYQRLFKRLVKKPVGEDIKRRRRCCRRTAAFWILPWSLALPHMNISPGHLRKPSA